MPSRLPSLPSFVLLALLTAPATALAQRSPLAADAPTPLPSPPALVHYTVESPMLLMVLLLCGALVGFLVLNSRGKSKHAGMLAGGFVVAAGALWIAARLVITDREKVLALTKTLVTNAATANIDALEANLAPDAALYPRASSDGIPKDQVLNRVRAMLGKNGAAQVTDYAVLEAQVQIVSPDLAYVQTYVRVTGAGAPVLSWWRLDATKPTGQDEWKIQGIKYLSSNFQIPDL